MATMQITSTNPKFSYLIWKNPETPLVAKAVRSGQLYGYFSAGRIDQYNIYFQDARYGGSFSPNNQKAYIDPAQYSSPVFPITATSELLASLLKTDNPDDTEGFTHTLRIPALSMQPKYFEIFSRYYPKIVHSITEPSPKLYDITLTTTGKLQHLVAYANLVLAFSMIHATEDYYLGKDEVAKYMNLITLLDAPYFARYVFKVNFLRFSELFDQFKTQLETTSRYKKLEMTSSRIESARITFVSDKLSGNLPILDIGCGEGRMMSGLASKFKTTEYIGVDIDRAVLEDARRRAERKGLTNCKFFASLEEATQYIESTHPKVEVIMAEVIEHMSLDEAKALLVKMKTWTRTAKLIVTTPCSDFNVHFNFQLGEENRHEDHKFELTSQEFNSLAAIHMAKTYGIGDCVDGVYMTQALICSPCEHTPAKILPDPNQTETKFICAKCGTKYKKPYGDANNPMTPEELSLVKELIDEER